MIVSHDPLTYPPLDTPKRVAPDVWIVDGPCIAFGLPGLKLRHPTRMTVLRLDDGSLLLHSPTAQTPELRSKIDALGTVRWIVGPNRVHYWWVPEWHAAYPSAEVWLAPRIRKQARERIDFPARELAAETAYPWEPSVATLAAPRGGFMTEYVFFHRPSRTLVLTDFIENHELEKVDSALERAFLRLAGATGKTPRDVRLFWSREATRRTVETMIAWRPERIILSHGLWYETDAVGQLRRAFGWVLRG